MFGIKQIFHRPSIEIDSWRSPIAEWELHGYRICVIEQADDAQEKFEQDLREVGVTIPLMHRAIWAHNFHSKRTLSVIVLDGKGKCQCMFGVEFTRLNSLPGALVARVYKFASATNYDARMAGLRSLVTLAELNRRIIRFHVEIFSLEYSILSELEKELVRLEFRRVEKPNCYQDTVVIDLIPSEEQIFASIHATARRHIRSVGKKSVEVRVITDPGEAKSISGLMKESLVQTGGADPKINWSHRIEFSKQQPHLSRIVGLYPEHHSAGVSPLAFVWACMHGEYVQYMAAGSTRGSHPRMPLTYALAWDLILWAKRQGAKIFDFGGISDGTHGSAVDPFGGISDFKRYFTSHKLRVGSEWIYEPHATLAKISDSVRVVAHRIVHRVGNR